MSARDLLLDAAERLVAERGLDVGLRDVAVAAGQRNNSAVQYHFGGRDGLIEAVVRRRQVTMERRRLELLAEHEASGAPDDVATLVGIMVRPMCDLPYREGATHYARFLEQARSHPVLSDRVVIDHQEWQATRILLARLGRALDVLPPGLRARRLRAMASAEFALLADRERQLEAGEAALEADDLVAMLVALVTAPVPARGVHA